VIFVSDVSSNQRPAVIPLGNGRYQVRDGITSRVAYAAGPPDARWVFLDGRVYVIDTIAARPSAARRNVSEQSALAAPMPATVTAVIVAEGQDVDQGDVLVVLEAMKMELPIRAPRRGRVAKLLCRQGELVQPGIPLAELE
jgi:acetyl/propionyl-CoA carboxylase alpha subunit